MMCENGVEVKFDIEYVFRPYKEFPCVAEVSVYIPDCGLLTSPRRYLFGNPNVRLTVDAATELVEHRGIVYRKYETEIATVNWELTQIKTKMVVEETLELLREVYEVNKRLEEQTPMKEVHKFRIP